MKEKRQQPIPPFDFAQGRLFGDDNKKGNCNYNGNGNGNYNDNGEMRGFLHCAAHKCVSSFGRNDDSWVGF
jgi:hypothetical protein